MIATQTLLGENEPAPFELINAGGRSNLVLVCDHASNRVPARLANLGLTEAQLNSHIGWDSGAAAVSRILSACLDAPLLLSNYSRLVIDCNRWLIAADSIPQSSGGVLIPGNGVLSEGEGLVRRLTLFEPYQAEIAALLSNAAPQCVLLSIHSFTPSLFGVDRPWSIGVCYRKDQELARRWLAALRVNIKGKFGNNSAELVGDNEPYSIEEGCDYTIPVQGESRGIPSIMLEIRQDKIQDPAGVQLWSDIIAEAWLSMQDQ
ncbi:MAG: N-formylglutamate amidohydrolase [Gammaproteobacteria bacterium]|nr:N-formylglutamate amidohydrolase [Gammaproteobacteria bacterium]